MSRVSREVCREQVARLSSLANAPDATNEAGRRELSERIDTLQKLARTPERAAKIIDRVKAMTSFFPDTHQLHVAAEAIAAEEAEEKFRRSEWKPAYLDPAVCQSCSGTGFLVVPTGNPDYPTAASPCSCRSRREDS